MMRPGCEQDRATSDSKEKDVTPTRGTGPLPAGQ